MRLSSLASALLLPLVAVSAQDTTITETSTQYATKTVTLSRVVQTTTMVNNTSTCLSSSGMGTTVGTVSSYLPTANTGSSSLPSTTTAAPSVSPTINNSGSALDAARVAAVAVAGVIVAALM